MDSVLNISEAANLALHAGMVLAQAQGEAVTARQMAQGLGVSYDHLAKVLQRLTKAGLVKAMRGPTGGFVLAKDPQRIRLLDLYQAIDGKFTVSRCLFGRKACPGGTCVMGDLLGQINHQVRKHLEERRLSDFMPGETGKGAS